QPWRRPVGFDLGLLDLGLLRFLRARAALLGDKVNDDPAHASSGRRWDHAERHQDENEADVDGDREREARQAAPRRVPVIGGGKAIGWQGCGYRCVASATL